MRKTLLAVGFAVLVSMMLAPHGGKHGIEGWAPFFSETGFEVSNGIRFGDTGRVMIDMLALEMVFLCAVCGCGEHSLATKTEGREATPRESTPREAAPSSRLVITSGHVHCRGDCRRSVDDSLCARAYGPAAIKNGGMTKKKGKRFPGVENESTAAFSSARNELNANENPASRANDPMQRSE
jgi:hypothetical protein